MTKILGITDEFTTCELCGKKELKCTVALDIDGEAVHYGRDCAGMTIWGKKSTNHTKKAGEIAEKIAYMKSYPDYYTLEKVASYSKPELVSLMFGEAA